MTLIRTAGWRKRAELLLDEAKRTPFEFGTHDCAIGWAGRLVHALVGIDPTERFQGRYGSADEALALIAAEGCADLGELVSKALAEALGESCDIHPGQLRVLDIAGVPDHGPFGVILSIVNGERLLAPGLDRMRHFDRRHAIRAWRIG